LLLALGKTGVAFRRHDSGSCLTERAALMTPRRLRAEHITASWAMLCA
jgi:hypothetical protein